MAIRVCIDAGHGGKDPGAVKGKRYEKNDTLKFALALGKVLEANGVEVVYTRKEDNYSSPTSKAKIGNRMGADFFISIHRNASVLKKASGAETLVYNKKGSKYTTAMRINNSMAALGFVDRKVKVRPLLSVLKRTTMPALLLEIGFITNDKDNALFDKKFDEIVTAVAKAFLMANGLKYKK